MMVIIPETLRRWIYAVECFLILVANIPLLCFIVYRRQLRERKEFVLLAGWTLADCVYVLGFLLTICFTPVKDENGEVGTEKLLACALQPRTVLLFIGTQLIGQMAVIVSIDRFLATVFPMKYYAYGVRYSTCIVILPFMLSTFFYLLNMGVILCNDVDDVNISALCLSSDIAQGFLKDYLYIQRMMMISASALIYLFVAVALFKKVGHRSTELSAQQKNMLYRANMTMGFTVLCNVCLVLVPDILNQVVVEKKNNGIRLLFISLILNKTMVTQGIFLFRHKELRAMIPCFLRKSASNSSKVIDVLWKKSTNPSVSTTSNRLCCQTQAGSRIATQVPAK